MPGTVPARERRAAREFAAFARPGDWHAARYDSERRSSGGERIVVMRIKSSAIKAGQPPRESPKK